MDVIFHHTGSDNQKGKSAERLTKTPAIASSTRERWPNLNLFPPFLAARGSVRWHAGLGEATPASN